MITADYTTLLRQSSMTAGQWLDDAVRELDKKFGEGYAKENPQLVAAFMNVAALDFTTSVRVIAIQEKR